MNTVQRLRQVDPICVKVGCLQLYLDACMGLVMVDPSGKETS